MHAQSVLALQHIVRARASGAAFAAQFYRSFIIIRQTELVPIPIVILVTTGVPTLIVIESASVLDTVFE